MKKPLLPLVCFAVLASSVSAKVVYVNKNATGATHDGTSWATAFLTVQAGVEAAVSHDEIWVAASTPSTSAYTEEVTLNTGQSLYGGFAGTETAISQRDWRTNATILDGAGNPSTTLVGTYGQGIVVDGFIIRNGGDGVSVQGGWATISNCEINNTMRGVYAVSGATTMTNCAVNRNQSGVLAFGATLTLANCTTSANTVEGVVVYSGTAAFTNCTISGNSGPGVFLYDGSGTATVTNCIIAFNNTGIHRSDTSTVTLSHNDVFGNTTANYSNITDPTGTNGNISLDPLFVDRDNKDYHLQPLSPCIDAGNDSVVTPGQTDLDGHPRISGAHVDMGAYEYSAGPAAYVQSEVIGATRVAGGLVSISTSDLARLDVAAGGGITFADAALIARKVAGLDKNP